VCCALSACPDLPVVCLTVKPVGKPGAENRHARFDERGWETERWPKAPSYRARPRLYQEVQALKPEAVVRGRDGYLRVYYEELGLRMQTWEAWVAAGRKIPSAARGL